MTAKVLAPSEAGFYELFQSARYSIFRLETLSVYGSSGEKVPLAAFLSDGPYRPSEGQDGWMAMLRSNARSGCVMRRVHVVAEPLTDYLRFELCWSYPFSVAAGEEIRIVSVADAAWPVDVPRHDFWLFDSCRLIDMHYDDHGNWLGVEPVDDPGRIVAANHARDAALHRSVPWATYVGDRRELAELVPAEVKLHAV